MRWLTTHYVELAERYVSEGEARPQLSERDRRFSSVGCERSEPPLSRSACGARPREREVVWFTTVALGKPSG